MRIEYVQRYYAKKAKIQAMESAKRQEIAAKTKPITIIGRAVYPETSKNVDMPMRDTGQLRYDIDHIRNNWC